MHSLEEGASAFQVIRRTLLHSLQEQASAFRVPWASSSASMMPAPSSAHTFPSMQSTLPDAGAAQQPRGPASSDGGVEAEMGQGHTAAGRAAGPVAEATVERKPSRASGSGWAVAGAAQRVGASNALVAAGPLAQARSSSRAVGGSFKQGSFKHAASFGQDRASLGAGQGSLRRGSVVGVLDEDSSSTASEGSGGCAKVQQHGHAAGLQQHAYSIPPEFLAREECSAGRRRHAPSVLPTTCSKGGSWQHSNCLGLSPTLQKKVSMALVSAQNKWRPRVQAAVLGKAIHKHTLWHKAHTHTSVTPKMMEVMISLSIHLCILCAILQFTLQSTLSMTILSLMTILCMAHT